MNRMNLSTSAAVLRLLADRLLR